MQPLTYWLLQYGFIRRAKSNFCDAIRKIQTYSLSLWLIPSPSILKTPHIWSFDRSRIHFQLSWWYPDFQSRNGNLFLESIKIASRLFTQQQYAYVLCIWQPFLYFLICSTHENLVWQTYFFFLTYANKC